MGILGIAEKTLPFGVVLEDVNVRLPFISVGARAKGLRDIPEVVLDLARHLVRLRHTPVVQDEVVGLGVFPFFRGDREGLRAIRADLLVGEIGPRFFNQRDIPLRLPIVRRQLGLRTVRAKACQEQEARAKACKEGEARARDAKDAKGGEKGGK